jgi:hypothetical protein
MLEAVGFHVIQAKGMLQYVQQCTQSALEWRVNEVPQKDSNSAIVCDYAQNTPLSHYDDGKPGEIYLFSALATNLTGIVDMRLTPNKFNCYAYHDVTAKKGSSNLAYLIMQDLFDMIHFESYPTAKAVGC